MAKHREVVNPTKRRGAPARTLEAREDQLISLAVDLAEKQLLDGSASSQVITELLKRSSSRERLEKEKLKKENELLKAKTESLQSMKDIKELYANAMASMRRYNGNKDFESEDKRDDNVEDD